MATINFPQRIVRKLLTRPIYELNTRRNYPIRQHVMSFPPINASAEDDSPILLIVTAPHYIYDACWAAYSLLLNLPSAVKLHIVVDGDLEEEQIIRTKRLLEGVKISKKADLLPKIPKKFKCIIELCEKHPMGAKLASLIVFHEESDVIYSDSDVLGFGAMPEFQSTILKQGSNLFLRDDNHLVEPTLVKHAAKLNVEPCQHLNAGFMFFKRHSLEFATAEKVLGESIDDPDFDQSSWFVEQTLMSLIMGESGAKPLPRERYIANITGQFYFDKDLNYSEIALRHFVSPIRFLMYQKGMPLLYKQIFAKAKGISTLPTLK